MNAPVPGNGSPVSRTPRAASREKLFLALMLLLPFVLLASLELGLRLVGFGGDHPLFIESRTVPGALEANPEVANRYMVTPGGAPFAIIDPIPFRGKKSPDAYRIVVQGGSSAAGYPYGRWGGLAGMLGDRLEATFPEREIEVVTTAMAAVNSYTLADLAEEIVAIEPDAVLIYAGHNEYIGVLGVGSGVTSSRASAQLRLKLRHLRLYQLVEWGVAQMNMVIASVLDRDRTSFFAKAASGAQIPFGSDAYLAGIEQFEANLDSLLALYARAGVDVYIGTLVSNEKDQPPFAGEPVRSVDRIAWNSLMEQRSEQDATGDLSATRGAKGLLELDPDAADAWFALGQLELASDRPREARIAFAQARDLDRLRVRAPGAFEESIRRLAARYGATVVEVEDRLRESVPNGLLGRELLLEHVHPNAEGYFLLADAFYEALRRDAVIGDWNSAPARDKAFADMPLTEIDRLLGHYVASELVAGPPFTDPPHAFLLPEPRNEVERIAQQLYVGEIPWLDAMKSLLQMRREQGRMEDAARIARQIAHAHPTEHEPNLAAGQLLSQLGRYERARLYFERALRAAPNDVSSLAALVDLELTLNEDESAAENLSRLRDIAPNHPLVLRGAMSGAR